MLTLSDGTILAVDDYCIKQKYNGINELSFSVPDDIKIVNEQSVHAKVRIRIGAIIWMKPCGTHSKDFSKEMAPRHQK